jgi:uncharacterized protein
LFKGSIGKKDKLFVMLQDVASNLKESSQYFFDFKIKDGESLKEFGNEMKKYEQKGDNCVHEIIVELNNTFITPIEREDILQLTMRMDDILDGLDSCAARFYMYNIVKADDYMVKFSEYINKCAYEIYDSIELASQKKLIQIREHAIRIKDYETSCDTLERKSIKELFEKEKDFVKLIQYKELYEILEDVADACQGVANTLETIIMKNA